jgi:hypothetical protein
MDATQLFFVVLDGPTPDAWSPWSKAPLSVLSDEIENDELLLLEEERQRYHFRVSVLPHGPNKLLTREQAHMRRIVGVLVDGVGYAGDTTKPTLICGNLRALCNKLGAAEQDPEIRCWYPKVGFYVLVATPGGANSTYLECKRELEGVVVTTLGEAAFGDVLRVSEDARLPVAIQELEYRMYSKFKHSHEQAPVRVRIL